MLFNIGGINISRLMTEHGIILESLFSRTPWFPVSISLDFFTFHLDSRNILVLVTDWVKKMVASEYEYLTSIGSPFTQTRTRTRNRLDWP
jgi:hypothetical protein